MQGKKNEATVAAVSVSQERGVPKVPVAQATFLPDYGIEGDAHGGPGLRQVSLLAEESVATLKDRVAPEILVAGRFAENITTRGIAIAKLKPGVRLAMGRQVILEVTQIGKQCHAHCAIYQQAGDCVMPREGVFARVAAGGVVRPGDLIEVLDERS